MGRTSSNRADPFSKGQGKRGTGWRQRIKAKQGPRTRQRGQRGEKQGQRREAGCNKKKRLKNLPRKNEIPKTDIVPLSMMTLQTQIKIKNPSQEMGDKKLQRNENVDEETFLKRWQCCHLANLHTALFCGYKLTL